MAIVYEQEPGKPLHAENELDSSEKSDFAKSVEPYASQVPLWLTPDPETIRALQQELMLARGKFPKNTRLTVALMEEVGELAKAELQGRHEAEIKKEALQVACVAIRIFEETDADFKTLTEAEKKP